jgi:hypothetical protein
VGGVSALDDLRRRWEWEARQRGDLETARALRDLDPDRALTALHAEPDDDQVIPWRLAS